MNCITETEGVQWEKAALNPPVSSWSVSLTVFQKNIVVTVLTKLVQLFLSKEYMRYFFFLRAFKIDSCQIETDAYKNNVSKFI